MRCWRFTRFSRPLHAGSAKATQVGGMKTSSKLSALALAGSAMLLPAVANASPHMPAALTEHSNTIGIIVACVAVVWAVAAGVILARQAGKQNAASR